MIAAPKPDAAALQSGVEVWRGGVSTWECDQMGHLNVRFYVTRVQEALVGLAAELGMPLAFSPHAAATLQVREHHIRFLREARAAAALRMIGGVVEMGETEARLLFTLVHAHSGEPAAAFQTLVRHMTPGEGRAFPWSKAVRERAAGLMTPIPAYAAARTLGAESLADRGAGAERAQALGLSLIAAGAVSARDCDTFGRLAADGVIGRMSGGAGRLVDLLRETATQEADPAAGSAPQRLGAAILEFRLAYLAWPQAGDRLQVYSGLTGLDQRALRIEHWMLNPADGQPWAVGQTVTAPLDLDARKLVPIGPAAQQALAPLTIDALAPPT